MAIDAYTAALRLDGWFETMRGADGYGGPVVHWWQNCFQFTGAGLDWRYEGIISGYLALYAADKNPCWLEKARGAAADLLNGQLPDGSFRNSIFELNPHPYGTPGESAAALALLRLTAVLTAEGNGEFERYLAAARDNVDRFYIGRLWDAGANRFRDDARTSSFVPNKSCTLSEALFLLADLTGDERYAAAYARPTLDAVIAHQEKTGQHRGAVYQNSFGSTIIRKIFPYYVGRCLPALVEAHRRFDEPRYLDAAVAAGDFLIRVRCDDGCFPQVLYENGAANRYLQWISPLGDMLRGLDFLKPYGFTYDPSPTLETMMSGQMETGGITSGRHFGAQTHFLRQRPFKPGDPPDFRDLIACTGWADKAFHYLARQASPPTADSASVPAPTPVERACVVRGRPAVFREDAQSLTLKRGRETLYHWGKRHRLGGGVRA